MKSNDERLKRAQQEQQARQKDVESGRVRVERPVPARESSPSQGQRKPA